MAERKNNLIEVYEDAEELLQQEQQRVGCTVEETFHPVIGKCYVLSSEDAQKSPVREYFSAEDFGELTNIDGKPYFKNIPEEGYGKFSLTEDRGRGTYTLSLSDKNNRVLYLAQMDEKGNISHQITPDLANEETRGEFEDAVEEFINKVKIAHLPSAEYTFTNEDAYETEEELLEAEKLRTGVAIEKVQDPLYGDCYNVRQQQGTIQASSMFQIVDFERFAAINDLEGQIPEKGYGKLMFLQDNKRNVSTIVLTGKDNKIFSVGQISADGKVRMLAGGQDIQLDVNKIIEENPRKFRQFAQEKYNERINANALNFQGEKTKPDKNMDMTDLPKENTVTIEQESSTKYKITAVYGGQVFNGEMTAQQHDKMMALDDRQRMTFLQQLLPKMPMQDMTPQEKTMMMTSLKESIFPETKMKPEVYASATQQNSVKINENIAMASKGATMAAANFEEINSQQQSESQNRQIGIGR